MWEPDGIPVDAGRFGEMDPEDILYEFDGPRIFSFRNPDGDLLLAYLFSEEDAISRYIVVPANPTLIEKLAHGRKSMRESLAQSWVWVVDVPFGKVPATAWKTDFLNLPNRFLPKAGLCVNPAHEPLLTVRLVGEGLGPENGVPASVITRAVSGSSKALKALVNWAAERVRAAGRPDEAIRKLYDLPANRFRIASFEVSFVSPELEGEAEEVDAAHDTLLTVGKTLQQGLAWATIGDAAPVEQTPEWIALLEALKNLAPPSHGLVQEVHVSGRMVNRTARPFVLTRRSTARIAQAQRAMRDLPREFATFGVIREFDLDKASLRLRPEQEGEDFKIISVPEDMIDDAFNLFRPDQRVLVVYATVPGTTKFELIFMDGAERFSDVEEPR